MEIPGGVRNVEPTAGQPVALPGVPLPPGPTELMTFQAPDPAGGKVALPGTQPATISVVVCARVPRFWPAMATLASGEISPNTGARKELPQVPLTVKPMLSLKGAQ